HRSVSGVDLSRFGRDRDRFRNGTDRQRKILLEVGLGVDDQTGDIHVLETLGGDFQSVASGMHAVKGIKARTVGNSGGGSFAVDIDQKHLGADNDGAGRIYYAAGNGS